MADNSSSMMIIPVGRDYPFMKGYKVLTASFGAMQIAAVLIKAGDKLPIAYYLAGAMLVVAVALRLIANSVPAGGEFNTLANLLDQVGIFLALTSLFFSFSIFLPPFISIAVFYWGAYLIMIIIIVCFFYRGINHPPQASNSAINNL